MEELAATRPDLVIQWAGRGPDYVDPILNAGLTTMLISYGTEAKTREYMTWAAEAMGKPERIAALIDWREQVLQEIQSKNGGDPGRGQALRALSAACPGSAAHLR
ncbi:hypothetical protein QW131_02860 [Roseibium salinum]|nr:hypothetical protein [Roseibium salinum]